MSRERVIVYTDTLTIETIIPSLGDREILRAASKGELARAIVERNRVIALIIEKTKIGESFLRLLSSIKRSFPLLEICLIADQGAVPTSSGRVPSEYRVVRPGDRMTEDLKAFVSGIDVADRRDHPRFDWPLKGCLSLDGRSWQDHNLWALSANGAFLESPTAAPEQGSTATLRISFQNSRMVTGCEVLDRRASSSRLPAGFAVRFTRLNEDSVELIDKIVQDALVQTLLEPDYESEIPTLDDETLTIPGFESF